MLNFYPPANPTRSHSAVRTFTPDIDHTCQAIHNACKGLGTDESALIAALGTKSSDQRFLLSVRYHEMFDKDLTTVLQHETSGAFGYLLQLLAQPLPEAEAAILRGATKGLGTTKKLLYPILLGRTNAEMHILKQTYFDKYGKHLDSVMASELRGDLQDVVLASLQAPLEDIKAAIHTPEQAATDAEALYNACEGHQGKTQHAFINILVTSPPLHLRAINTAYKHKYKHDITDAVTKTFRGDAREAVLFLVRMVLEPLELLAELFESTMKGLGTDEKALSAALVRYHLVQREIEPVFHKTYGKHLRDRIQGEVSGHYGKLALAFFDSPVH